MEEWKEYRVAEVIEDISMGPFGSNIKRDNYVDSGVPYLNGSNLSSYKLNENSFYYVTEEKAKSLGRCVAKRGDIIVTHRGTIGQMSYIPFDSKYEHYLTGNSQFRLTVNKKVIRPDFFVYYFHTRMGQHRLLANASQVGVPALARPTSTFKEVLVPVPKMEVQNQIMDILHSLDDKIEVNRRINDNLEQQAQALFKSWFVDFEPFKDQPFVESELGMIPQGWKVDLLGNLVDIKYGKDHKKLMDGNIPVYGSGGLMRKAEKALYSGESVLIPRKGTLNNVMYVNEAFWTVDTMFYSIPKVDNIMLFTFIYLSNRDLASLNTGSAVPSMTTEILNNMKVALPNHAILEDFNKKTKALFKLIKHNEDESRHLAELRDTLLPKLMSGELKVNDVDA